MRVRRGTVKTRVEEVARGLEPAPPTWRKTVVKKLALAVGAMVEGPTPNTVALAHGWPLKTERPDLSGPWRRRGWKNPWRVATAVIEPLAGSELIRAARNPPTVRLSLDQTD